MATARFLRFFTIASVGFVALLAFLLAYPKEPSAPSLLPPAPNPNGYDDFLRAAQLLNGRVPDATNHSSAEIRAFAEENQAPLEAIQAGLGRDCRVPVQISQAYLARHMNELGGIKKLAQLLVVGGKSAQLDGKNHEAARYYMDAIRLGQAVSRGGLVIDVMVGHACQGIGLRGLHSLRQTLTVAETSEIIRVLEAIDNRTEPAREVFAREKIFFRNAYGWWQTAMPRLVSFVTGASGRVTAEAQAENSLLRGQAKFRLAILEMALDLCKTKTGGYPETLAAIAPRLSKEVRCDLFSGREFVYRRRDDGYLLYSVGPDRKDDGGQPMSQQRGPGIPTGDILPE